MGFERADSLEHGDERKRGEGPGADQRHQPAAGLGELHQEQCRHGIGRELPVEERDGKHGTQGQGLAAQQPRHEHPQERLDVSALGFDQVGRGDERREGERGRRQRRQPGVQAGVAHQQPPQHSAVAAFSRTIVRRSAKTVGPKTANTGAMTHDSTPSMYSWP